MAMIKKGKKSGKMLNLGFTEPKMMKAGKPASKSPKGAMAKGKKVSAHKKMAGKK